MSTEEQSRLGASRLAPRGDVSALMEPGHFVQFYEDEVFLLDEVSRFIGGCLEASGGAVVIVTKPHLDGIEHRLNARGLDMAAARDERRYVSLDAAETLSGFMDDGWPNPRRFADIVGGLFARMARERRPFVRAFGEMVALLCADGNHKAAIRLEELWNELGESHSFSLLCAYPIRGFARAADWKPFIDICAEHSRVIPTESYATVPTPSERLRIIAELQQKAHSLETEVARRREAEAALTDFLENSVVAMHRAGPDGIILWANKAELRLLGYAPEEYIGHHIAEFHVDRPVVDGILEKLLQGQSLHDHPARLRCKNGSIKDVLIDSNALWQEGKFVHTRCFTRDVTDRRCAERERDELLAHAEAANRSKDAFLAMLSHELRSPLTAILGWTRILRASKLDEAATARALETIERNTRLQAQLVDDLLDVSRIVSGKLRLDQRPVDLVTIMEAACDSVRASAEAKALKIIVTRDPVTRTVWGDAGRLQQVIWNLLSNAVKFTPARGKIDIRLQFMNGHARIAVSDTGSGIPARILPHIFERFRQDDGATTRRHGGLGLGLSIARDLVERHGGTIEAESQGEGRGATFTVTLPVMTEGFLLAPASSAGNDASDEPLALDGLHVLVVDDEVDSRDVLVAVLRNSGADATAVASVSEALDAYLAIKPDVVVADIGMPEEDGYDLIRKIRALGGRGGQIPAIAVTAEARHEDRERALSAGYDLHVAKPIDPSRLTRAVAQLARR